MIKSLKQSLVAPLLRENPVTLHVLGICSALAITNSLTSSLVMSAALTVVLIISNAAISLMRNHLPSSIRMIVQITIIASAVTVIDQLLTAYLPESAKTLSVYVSLIVTNCIVLGRAEAFASKNGVVASMADALGMGFGFTLALVLLGGTREFLTSGSLFQIKLIEGWSQDFMLMGQAPGAFILLGVFLGIINWFNIRKAKKEGRSYTPTGLSCSSCNLCDLGKD